MSEKERGEARAQGALANFLAQMLKEMDTRSPEYRRTFWAALEKSMNATSGLEELAECSKF